MQTPIRAPEITLHYVGQFIVPVDVTDYMLKNNAEIVQAVSDGALPNEMTLVRYAGGGYDMLVVTVNDTQIGTVHGTAENPASGRHWDTSTFYRDWATKTLAEQWPNGYPIPEVEQPNEV